MQEERCPRHSQIPEERCPRHSQIPEERCPHRSQIPEERRPRRSKIPEERCPRRSKTPEERRPRRSQTTRYFHFRNYFGKEIKHKRRLTRTSTIRKNDVPVVQKKPGIFISAIISVKK